MISPSRRHQFLLGPWLARAAVEGLGGLVEGVFQVVILGQGERLEGDFLGGGDVLAVEVAEGAEGLQADAGMVVIDLLAKLFQMVSLLPGISRSGATIVGALLLGTDKRSAAEFTFFLALPIMIGAFAYDSYKNRELIAGGVEIGIAIGFAAAFIVALLVIRKLLDFVAQHGFAPFAYWRIFAGALGLWGVLLFK